MIQTSKANIVGDNREEKELQILKNSMTLQKMDQNLEVLMEKMTDFELKLNYVLLRRTKIKKRMKKEIQSEAEDRSNQEIYLNQVLRNSSKKFKAAFIYLSLILLFICALLSLLYEIIVVDESLF